jgi:hypothetical protein
MGCDWYNIQYLSGLGYFTTNLPSTFSSTYPTLVLTDTTDGETLQNFYFIYDPNTLFYHKLQIPGPYEITLSEHVTKRQEVSSYVKVFRQEIQVMESIFQHPISYWSIQTTMGVGELTTNNSPFQSFSSVESYDKYHGYNSYK